MSVGGEVAYRRQQAAAGDGRHRTAPRQAGSTGRQGLHRACLPARPSTHPPVGVEHNHACDLLPPDAAAEQVHDKDAGGHKQAAAGGIQRLPLSLRDICRHLRRHLERGCRREGGGCREVGERHVLISNRRMGRFDSISTDPETRHIHPSKATCQHHCCAAGWKPTCGARGGCCCGTAHRGGGRARGLGGPERRRYTTVASGLQTCC